MKTADRRAPALVGQAAYGVCVEYRHLGAMTHLCCQAWNVGMEQEQRNSEWRARGDTRRLRRSLGCRYGKAAPSA